MRSRLLVAVGVLVVVLGVFGGPAAFLASASAINSITLETAHPSVPSSNSNSFINEIFGGNAAASAEAPIAERAIEIVSRLLLAVFLAGVLALRPRRNIRLVRRNLHVSQTEILLAVVAAGLMMIVGDNAARAFGIFAAVSLVRFRTNIRDPKEITVLLISMALGLAAGVGRWELGIALCLFALALLWLLEYNEPGQVFRSMQLKVKARDTDKIHEILKKIFRDNALETEVREIDPPDDKKPVGAIVYYVSLPLSVSTDRLSEIIIESSSEHLEGIEWEQQKNQSDIYQ